MKVFYDSEATVQGPKAPKTKLIDLHPDNPDVRVSDLVNVTYASKATDLDTKLFKNKWTDMEKDNARDPVSDSEATEKGCPVKTRS